jgi:hypothetical protein
MRTTTSVLIAALMLGLTSPALAAGEPGSAPSAPPPDTRFGHLYVAPTIGWTRPMGSAEDGLHQIDYAGWGPSFGADVGFGVSRYVVLDAWGAASSFGGGDVCTTCSAKSTVIGFGAQYHLIEGTPFDPWMGFGVGWRTTKFEAPGGESATYSGLEWARLIVGGDWHPWPILGFGPYLELDVGRYGSRSPGEIGNGAMHSFLTVGARVVLDPIR